MKSRYKSIRRNTHFKIAKTTHVGLGFTLMIFIVQLNTSTISDPCQSHKMIAPEKRMLIKNSPAARLLTIVGGFYYLRRYTVRH